MTFEVTVNGRSRTVAIEAADHPHQVAVTIDDRRRVVDASWIDADTLSMIDGGAACEIRLHRRDNGGSGVEMRGTVYEAVVEKGLRRPFSSDTADKSAGAFAIRSPMPGRVVRVLVAVGDRVAARQAVVVVEAMKMENELRAPRAGTVKEIAASAGSAVETGAVLVVVE